MSTTIKVTGLKELTDSFKRLNDKMTRDELVKIQRKGAAPLLKIAQRLTPVGKPRKTKTGNKFGGDLRKSLKIFTGKNKEFPSVMIGHAAGRGKNPDGYYGFWVHEGTKNSHKASKHLETASGFTELSEEIIFKELSDLIDKNW